jgi:hypothetical protein
VLISVEGRLSALQKVVKEVCVNREVPYNVRLAIGSLSNVFALESNKWIEAVKMEE